MSDVVHVRCSALPLAFKCGGSVRPGVIPINASSDAADVGTAGHEGLATMVRRGGHVDWDGVPELAKKHGVDEKELRVLLALGLKLWQQVGPSFPNPSAEVSLKHQIGPVSLTGHPDVISLSGSTVRIQDWKLGRLDSNYREQLLGYCALGLLTAPSATDAESGVAWVREQEYEPHTMTRAGLFEWLGRLETEVVNWDGTYRPGSHCQYCPRSHECQAANAQARRDMAIIMDRDLPGHLEDAQTLREMIQNEPEKVVQLVKLARQVAKQAERAIDAIKDEVVRSGPIVGGGEKLELMHTEKRHLDVLQAFPVLQDQLDDQEMAEVISISLSKAEGVVSKKAGKGKGAGAVRALQAKLTEVGAIQTSSSASLVLRRET